MTQATIYIYQSLKFERLMMYSILHESHYLKFVLLSKTIIPCFSTYRKLCSGSKLREFTGSGIFAAGDENGASESDASASNPNKTGVRMYQVSFKIFRENKSTNLNLLTMLN